MSAHRLPKRDYDIEMHFKKSIISSHLTNLYIKNIACILSHVCQKENVRKQDQNKNKNEFEERRHLNCLYRNPTQNQQRG